MKVLRTIGLSLVFLSVMLGWIFVAGILRYGSVEDFGLRVRRAVAMSGTATHAMLPAPSAADANDLAARLTALPPAPTKTRAAQAGIPLTTQTPDLPRLPAATATPIAPAEPAPTLAPEPTIPPDSAAASAATSAATSAAASASPLAADAQVALPDSAALAGLRHEWQTWNNCGPATLATYLSYYGGPLNQAQIGGVLRRSEDDKNVSPEELHDFAVGRGMHAILRANGSSEMLRTLVANGYPVLIETWLEEDPNDGMGHYRLVTGYDDLRQAWILYDSYVATELVQAGGKDGVGAYAGVWLDYETAEAWWKVFNRTYLLVYPPEDEAAIQTLLGEKYLEDQWLGAEAQARTDIARNDVDAFAWFNLGSSLWMQGRAEEAALAFDRARTIGLPWRMLWYQFHIFPTYLAVGRASDAVTLADATLANTASIEEIHYWRGEALLALGNSADARAAYQRALALYPQYTAALTALANLP